jgi:hypothetical protein
LRAPIEKPQGRSEDLLPLRRPELKWVNRQGLSSAMNGVARQAWDGWLIDHEGVLQSPRPASIDRLDQFPQPTLKMHPMTAQAIVHQEALMVVALIQEYLAVGRAVRARPPLGEFRLVARAAAFHHAEYIPLAHLKALGERAPHVVRDAFHVVPVERDVGRP